MIRKLMPILAAAALVAMVIISAYAWATMPPKPGSEDTVTRSSSEEVNLDGPWKSDKSENDVYFEALIKGNSIEVNIISTDPLDVNNELTALYWVGTFRTEDNKVWTSVGDRAKLDSAILGSTEIQKSFTLQDDKLQFRFGALGTTKVISLKKG